MARLSFIAAALCATALTTPIRASAAAHPRSQITVLHTFDSTGYGPYGGITLAAGALYGTTASGGSNGCLAGLGCGTVYQLAPAQGGGWNFQTLYQFQGGADDAYPASLLAVDPAGAVYGFVNAYTPGTVYRLLPPSQGGSSWTFQILYRFKNGTDGHLGSSSAALIIQGGSIYGIASGGPNTNCGRNGCGSVYRLDPGGNDPGGNDPGGNGKKWTKTVLYAFSGSKVSDPISITGFDQAGNLYVATDQPRGALLQLSPAAPNQPWHAKIISRFGPGNHSYPSNLVLAANGDIYATTTAGFSGPVVQVAPNGAGWARTVAAPVGNHGYGASSLAAGPNGSLIGVIYGDQDLDFGTAFQLSPPQGGANRWTNTELWNFNYGPDQNPINIVADQNGVMYGVISGGGYTNGTIFELQP